MTSSGTYICHESSVKLRLPWTCGYQRLGVPVEASRAQTVMIAVVSMSELLPIVVQVMLTSTFWRSAVARHPSYGELRWKPVVTNARQSRSESRTEKNWCQGHAKRKRLVSARSAPLRAVTSIDDNAAFSSIRQRRWLQLLRAGINCTAVQCTAGRKYSLAIQERKESCRRFISW